MAAAETTSKTSGEDGVPSTLDIELPKVETVVSVSPSGQSDLSGWRLRVLTIGYVKQIKSLPEAPLLTPYREALPVYFPLGTRHHDRQHFSPCHS
jgi:hypothetical protein